jgi:hypothetical protein
MPIRWIHAMALPSVSVPNPEVSNQYLRIDRYDRPIDASSSLRLNQSAAVRKNDER